MSIFPRTSFTLSAVPSAVVALALSACGQPTVGSLTPSAPAERGATELTPSPDQRIDEDAVLRAQRLDEVGAYLTYRLLARFAAESRPADASEERAFDALYSMGLDPRSVGAGLEGPEARPILATAHAELMKLDLEADYRELTSSIYRHAPEIYTPPSDEEPTAPPAFAPTASAAESAGLRCLDLNNCIEIAGDAHGNYKANIAKSHPELHSAYGDMGSHGAPGWKPAGGNQALHVPVAYTSFGSLEAAPVACQTDADCSALGDQRPTCMPLDSDADTVPMAEAYVAEYEPCVSSNGYGTYYDVNPEAVLDGCLPGGGNFGHLASQAGVPQSLLDSLPAASDPLAGAVSVCGLAPSWSSPGGVEVTNVDTFRVYVAVDSMTDVNAGATLLRVADAEGRPLGPIATVRMPDGDLEVVFDNGQRQSAVDFQADGGAFAEIEDTVTIGAQGASQPLLEFLVDAPNEVERYLQPSQTAVDDLWVVDLPEGLPAGVYELRADWHAQAYVDALYSDGSADEDSPLGVLYDQCREAWALAGASALDGMCEMYNPTTYTGTLETDYTWLSNPVYIRIVDGQRPERVRFEVPDFRLAEAQETYDDPTFQTVMMAIDTSAPASIEACQEQLTEIAAGGKELELSDLVEPTDCLVRSFGKGPFDDLDEGKTYPLDFSATFDLGPDHEVVMITEMWEDDDDGATSAALLKTKTVVLAVKDLFESAESDDGGEEGDVDVGAVLDVVGTLLQDFTSDILGLKKPEYLGKTSASYSYDDVLYLTHAAQQGRSSADVLAAHTSGDRPLPSLESHTFQATLAALDQGTVTVTDQPYLDGLGAFVIHGDTVWGEHHQIRRVHAVNPDGTWGSDDSTYELHHAITHVRD